jgi:hypothetical protein
MSVAAALLLVAQTFAIEKPDQVRLRPIEASRALDEFEAICLTPMFDADRTTAAVASSTIAYKPEPKLESGGMVKRRWTAPNAIATLILPADPHLRGFGMPQCEVAMGESEARPPRAVLELLLPRLKRHVRTKIAFEPDRVATLSWADKAAGEIYELDLDTSNDGKPTQSLNFVLTVFTPQGRRTIEAAIKKETSRP